MASCCFPRPPATPWVLDLTSLFTVPVALFHPLSPSLVLHRPYNQVPHRHLDQRTQQTSPQMPQVFRHRLQGHLLPRKNSEGKSHNLLSQEVNSKLPRMPALPVSKTSSSGVGGRRPRPSTRLRRWFLPPGGGAGRESPGSARTPATWAGARARPGSSWACGRGPWGRCGAVGACARAATRAESRRSDHLI